MAAHEAAAMMPEPAAVMPVAAAMVLVSWVVVVAVMAGRRGPALCEVGLASLGPLVAR